MELGEVAGSTILNYDLVSTQHSPFQLHLHINDRYSWIAWSLKYSDMHIHCEMIATVQLTHSLYFCLQLQADAVPHLWRSIRSSSRENGTVPQLCSFSFYYHSNYICDCCLNCIFFWQFRLSVVQLFSSAQAPGRRWDLWWLTSGVNFTGLKKN